MSSIGFGYCVEDTGVNERRRVARKATEGMTENLIDREGCHLSGGEGLIAGGILGGGGAAGHCSRACVLELAIAGSVVAHACADATRSNETAKIRSAVNGLCPIAVWRRKVDVRVRQTGLLLYCRRVDDDGGIVPRPANLVPLAVEDACAVSSRYDSRSVHVECHVVVEQLVGSCTQSAAAECNV